MFVLGGFQIASHLTNYNANNVLEAIRSKALVKGKIIPIITPNDDGSGDTLKICDDIPQSNTDPNCYPIFDAPPDNQPQKPKQDQGAATTTYRDVFSDLGDALYTPPAYTTTEVRVFSAPRANIAPTSGVTNVANRPAVTGVLLDVPSPASVNGKQVVSSGGSVLGL